METLINFLLQFEDLNKQQIELILSKGTLLALKKTNIL